MNNLETYSWDPKDPYGVRNIRPRSSPSAPKGGRPPLSPHSGEVEPVVRLKKFKPRTASKVLSTALHFERKTLADLERDHSTKRFRSTAFINFCTLLEVSQHHPLIKTVEQVTLVFDHVYVPKRFLTLAQVNSLDPVLFENADSGRRPNSPHINWDLFPKANPIQPTIGDVTCDPIDPTNHTPQSGVIPPTPVNPFTECSDAIRETFTTYVTHNQYLAWLATMPLHYLVLGSAFCLIVFYRMCKDLFLTVRFMTGFLFGYRVVHLRHKYSPQSGSLETAKTFSQYLSKVATVAAAFVSLATLVADKRKIDSYSPQSGLDSDDGAKFLGKVTPKVGSTPDKPATSGAPGITSILRRTSNVQPSQQQPKISRKDPNDGPLNGFGVGI